MRAPRANAHAERFVRTVRGECLDWLLILGRRHLESVMRSYIQHCNTERRIVDSRCGHPKRGTSAHRPAVLSSAATASAASFTSYYRAAA